MFNVKALSTRLPSAYQKNGGGGGGGRGEGVRTDLCLTIVGTRVVSLVKEVSKVIFLNAPFTKKTEYFYLIPNSELKRK